MPEVEFTIDTDTGKCATEIKGIRGPACEQAAKHLKRLLGEPAVDNKTKEYYVMPQTRRQIQGNGK